MFRKKAFWISLIVVLALAGGGYAYYSYVYRPSQEVAEQIITTAQVYRGDVVVSVSGSGTLSAASEVDLGFQSEGYLDEVLVEIGDWVQEGDVLARLEMDDLEVAVAEAEIKARLAQLSLDDVLEGPTDAELANARAALQSAQVALTVAQYTYDSALNSDLDSAVRSRYIEYQWTADRYWDSENGDASQDDLEESWDDRASAEYDLNVTLRQAEMEELETWNQVDQAQNRVYQALESLELLQSEPTTDTILRAELTADQALLALDDARDALEAAELRAPFDGTVVDVTATPGEHVGTASIITLADLEEPVLQFWVEESDTERRGGGQPGGDRLRGPAGRRLHRRGHPCRPGAGDGGWHAGRAGLGKHGSRFPPGQAPGRYERRSRGHLCRVQGHAARPVAGAARAGRGPVRRLCGAAGWRDGNAPGRGGVDGLCQRRDHLWPGTGRDGQHGRGGKHRDGRA